MKKTLLLTLLFAMFCAHSTSAQRSFVSPVQASWEVSFGASQMARARPPLSTGRLLGEYAAGVGLGTALGILGGLAGRVLSGSCEDEFFGCLGGVVLGVLFGYLAGATIGVHAVGSSGPEDGSRLLTLAGVGLGLIVSGVVVSERWPEALQVFFGLSIPVWGGIGGFNLTRRYDPGAGPTAEHRVQVRVGVPMPVLVRNPGGQGYAAAIRLPLLQIRF